MTAIGLNRTAILIGKNVITVGYTPVFSVNGCVYNATSFNIKKARAREHVPITYMRIAPYTHTPEFVAMAMMKQSGFCVLLKRVNDSSIRCGIQRRIFFYQFILNDLTNNFASDFDNASIVRFSLSGRCNSNRDKFM